MPPLDLEKVKKEFNKIDNIENIINSTNAIIIHDQGDQAFYSPMKDEIHLPPREQFKSEPYYYATTMHELGHWTGHETRLDRDQKNTFGTPAYAREELVAEMSSYLMAMETGLPHDPSQHAAYVKSWISKLKESSTEIFKAANEAEKVKNFILHSQGLENHKTPPKSLIDDKVKTNAYSMDR
jgi:putative DNA primase/helicase